VLAVAPVRHRVVRGWWAVTHGELDAALSGRLDGWRVALELTQRHPLAGVGWGAYRAEFAGARLRLMAAGMPFFLGHVNPSFANAHNELLEVGADLGWPGLLALAWALALVGRAAWRARRRMSAADAGLCFGGLVAAALLALFYFPFRLAPVAFGWVAFLAWLLATGDGAEEATGRKRWPALALTALLVLALLGQGVRGWHRLQSSVLVRFVQQQGMALGSARPPGGLVRAELQVLRQAHRRAPATIEPLAFEGDLLLLAGRLDEAVAAYRRAVALEPRAEVFFNWGLALWSQGRVDEAVVQLRRGVALGPRFRGRVPPGAQPLVAVAPVRPL
jgi:tetratricopeptide (TPR) repeat protein